MQQQGYAAASPSSSSSSCFFSSGTPSCVVHRLPLKPTSLLLPPKKLTLSRNSCSLTLHPAPSNCTLQSQDSSLNPPHHLPSSSVDRHHRQFHHSENPDPGNREEPRGEGEEEEESSSSVSALGGNLASMWWVDLRAAVGQRINLEGIVSSVSVFARERHLAVPHVAVPDVRHIDWAELRRRGFRGVVFDKDNTITVPYTLTLWPPLEPSIQLCKSVFGNDIAVFSNSAGLYEYDHDGSKARSLEKAIGIKVIRHTEVPSFSPFVLLGNSVRKLEMAFLKYCSLRGFKPTNHSLLPDALKCVKDPTPL
ncbi:hypothetical protein Tsubulata_029562 [Turnera subulata]|uniref:Uncharacterized protein n=1 Tax=Turnera subulata TaxID=218843 RepID=A0A9Q0F2S3_9ROSI|nr:hypothetical protein Tsubulata_029562 [Turnera subulata]